MSLSIRWRLAAGIVIAFMVTMVAIFATVHFSLGRILTDDLDRGLSHDIDRVLAEVALAGSLDDTAKLEEIVQRNSLSSEAEPPFITVIRDLDGRVLAHTEGVTVELLELRDEELQKVAAGGAVSSDVELPGAREFRFRTERLTIGGEVVGVVQVAEATETASEPVDRLQVILIAEGIGALLLVLAIAWWLSRGAVKPLERVIDVAAEIEASDLHRRIGARNQPAEVQKLADTFDAMLARLDKAFEEQRSFVLDVSHELRTPLTALRGNIDVLLMSPGLDAETRADFERMQAEVGRLIRLTANLLYLASADTGRQPERRPVELDVLCLEVYRQSRDLRSDVKLNLAHEDQVTVVGDRDLLKQMLLNLVENGVKFSSAGGKVDLALYRDDHNALIVVKDTGPGIPPEALPHIFKRFYRAGDRARAGGTGLGLAIADWIVRSHGGEIKVESDVGRGSTFTVRLPLDTQELAAESSPPTPAHEPAASPRGADSAGDSPAAVTEK